MHSPLTDLPGAVEADGPDAGVAAHYGDPMREQRALESGTAFVDLSARGVLSVAGADRLTWLDSLGSQLLRTLEPGRGAETLLLGPRGRLEHDLHVVDDGATLWLIVEREETADLLAWLESMRFLLRVEPADRSAEFAVVGAADPEALGLPVARSEGVALVWRDPWSDVQPGGHQYAAEPHPARGRRWAEALVPRAELAALAERVRSGGLAAAGVLAAEALRIAAWRPRFAREVDERSLPHELDLLRSAVHLSKGCYRGQETVAKAHNLGHPPRRLVFLHLDGSEGLLPEPGAEVSAVRDGTPHAVGHVTSSARHHELGPIALALVKRTADPEATLQVDAGETRVSAAQQVIVPPSAGRAADVPRMPRLGAR